MCSLFYHVYAFFSDYLGMGICQKSNLSLCVLAVIGVDFLLIKQIPRGQNVFAKFGKLNNSISVGILEFCPQIQVQIKKKVFATN